MPGATAGTVSVPLDMFGGMVTDMSPADLPPGVSPDCQDVKFISGGVTTRPGLVSQFAAIAGNPTVNYLKTYIPQSGLLRLLLLDSAGALWKESSVGVLSQVASGLAVSSYGKSASLFTREYIAIGDGKNGNDLPRQFDDANFDRVSQVGPGAAPSLADENVSATVAASPNGATEPATVAIAASPNGTSEVGNICTVVTSAAHGLSVGDTVTIAGVTVAGYNGNFTVASVISSTSFTYVNSTTALAASGAGTSGSGVTTITTTAVHGLSVGETVTITGVGVSGYNGTFSVVSVPSTTTFTYRNSTGGLAGSGGGTVTVAGSITAGIHKCVVIFKTRQGYLSAPSPTASWTSAGGRRVVVSSIPVGPPNVIARIVAFTAAAGASFFFIAAGGTLFSSNMVISDNTTTTASFDFTDSSLLVATNVDALFKLIELAECAGVISYASRLFWWGERNKQNNWLNLTFDGGFSNPGSLPNFPLGWTNDPSFGPGGGKDTTAPGGGTQPGVARWGEAYGITGNGATATRGLITQPAVQDANGVLRIAPNTDYTVRASVARNSTLAQGTLHVHLFGTGVNTTGLQVTAAQAGTSYAEFTAQLTAPLAAIPSDLVLRVFADGTPTSNGQFYVDNIQVYPTAQPFNKSLVRASKAEDPESYDGVNGFLNVNENDGLAIRGAFVIRENLYFVKEHSTWVTQDDGANPPSLWSISEVSRKVGTPSVRGVAVGEDWAVIAHRTGLYITWGGEPVKISQEIQPTWDQINWNFGQKLWVEVDTQNKRILIGAPFGSATAPNKILMLDYRTLDTAQAIADSGPIRTSYTGKLIATDHSRKWSPWTIAANAGALVERFDGTQAIFTGNGAGNGKVYQLSEPALKDDAAAIPSYYTTFFHFHHDQEMALQIDAHQKLFTYLAQFVEGAGNLLVSAILPGGLIVLPLASLTLSNPGTKDLELPINVTASRAAFKMTSGVNAGDWFRLTKFIVNAMPHPSMPVRGFN